MHRIIREVGDLPYLTKKFLTKGDLVHDIKLKSNEQPQKAKKFFEKINIVADLLGIFVALAIFITILIQITGRLIRNPAPWTGRSY